METPYKDKNGRIISVGDCVEIETTHGTKVIYNVLFGAYADFEQYMDYTHHGFHCEIANENLRERERYTLPDIANICISFTPVKVTSTIV